MRSSELEIIFDHVYTVKKDFMIEKQLPHLTMKYNKCLSCPPPFYATQIISSFFLSQGSQPITIKYKDFQPMVKGDCFSIV